MKRNTRLIIVVLVTVLWSVVQPLGAEAKTSDHASTLSCANPSPGDAWRCAALEHQILASTVQLQWSVSTKNDDGSGPTVAARTGHATVVEGRYLVTHNHLDITSLSNPREGERILVSVYTVNGRLIWSGALVAVTIAAEDAETLVLDFGDYRGMDMFTAFGMASAELEAWGSLSLQPGTEVAQVDWDGTTTHVDWVAIEDVVTDSGTPRLELANYVSSGASGGGVFWNGHHIANNWYRATASNANSGVVVRQYSAAALNSTQAATAVHLAPKPDEPAGSRSGLME